MTSEHGRYADWDAAYVLGALSSADRRAFEDHLDECTDCRSAIAELAPTVGLLSRLSTDAAARIDEGPDAAGGATLVSLATQRARRRRRSWWIGAAAAVVIAVAAVAVPVTIAAVNRPGVSFALEDVAGVPIEASVRLTGVAWGTRVELECRYPGAGGSDAGSDGWVYELAVVGRDGTTSSLSSWKALPGATARLSAGTALGLDAIQAIEIRSAKGTVLMRYEVEAG